MRALGFCIGLEAAEGAGTLLRDREDGPAAGDLGAVSLQVAQNPRAAEQLAEGSTRARPPGEMALQDRGDGPEAAGDLGAVSLQVENPRVAEQLAAGSARARPQASAWATARLYSSITSELLLAALSTRDLLAAEAYSPGSGAAAGSEAEAESGAGATAGAAADASAASASPAASGLSFWQGLLISVNFTVGIAVLTTPGLAATIGRDAYLIVAATLVLQATTGWLLATIMIREPAIKSFADIAREAARRASGGSLRAETAAVLGLRVFQGTYLFFCCVFVLAIVQETLRALFPALNTLGSALGAGALGCVSVAFTLSTKLLSYAGAVGVTALIVFLIALIIGDALAIGPDAPSKHNEFLAKRADLQTTVATYGSLLLLADGHPLWPSVFNALEDRRHGSTIVTCTVLVVFALVFVITPLAVIAFGVERVADSLIPGSYLPMPSVIFSYVVLLVKVTTQVVCCFYPIITEYGVPALRACKTRCCAAPAGAPAADKRDNHSRPPTPVPLHLAVGFSLAVLAVLVGALVPSLHFVMTLSESRVRTPLCRCC